MLQPPTDNLYKFLAIGGLASVIASTYFLNLQDEETYGRRLKLEQELEIILSEFHATHGSPSCHDGLGQSDATPDSKMSDSLAFGVAYGDREGIIAHLDLHAEQLRKLTAHPRVDNEKREFWKKWFTLTDQQLDGWIQDESLDSRIARVRSAASSFRPKFANSLQIARQIWKIEDAFNVIAIGCTIGVIGGLCITTVGFVLWYFFVQRIQDKILRLELTAKSKGNGQ